ncbi:MAG: hypothetical protein QM477_01170 [Planctomycetota bacterium]
MSKLLTLTCLFGALTFASCSGEEKPADITTTDEAATVISESDAAANAAEEITDEAAANAALDSMLDG